MTNHRLAVGLELGLDYANSGNDQTLIDMRLNEGVRKVLRDTHCYVTEQTVTPGADQIYTLHASILDIVDLWTTSSSQDYPLERATLREINYLSRSSGASAPVRYYTLLGANALKFWPAPGATDELTVTYVPVPTAMSSGAHDSSSVSPTNYGGVPADYDEMIQLWALHRLASFDDDQSSAQGKRYLDEYREKMREARREIRRKGGHRLAPARVNRRRRPLRVHPSDDV